MGIGMETQFKMVVGFGGGEGGTNFTLKKDCLSLFYLVSSVRSVAPSVTKISLRVLHSYFFPKCGRVWGSGGDGKQAYRCP